MADPALGDVNPSQTSVLRRMAFNHAQRRAGLLSVYLWAVTIGLAGVAAAASGFSGALGWVLPVLALAQLIVPAWHTEHARSLFRDFIRRHDAVRAELEHQARSDDGRGPFAFGPL